MAMERELKELKSVLRSLVVSSPAQMDVRSLLRDYRTMMGAPVPIAKYGHRDPMMFLREHCNDCFLFNGPSSNPILTLIVPDTLKHIDQFVQRQKVSSTVKFKGKRRSVPEHVMKQPDLIAHTFVPNSKLITEVNHGKTISKPVEPNINTTFKPVEPNKKITFEPVEPNKNITFKPVEPSKNFTYKPVQPNNNITYKPLDTNKSLPKAKESSTNKTHKPVEINSNTELVKSQNSPLVSSKTYSNLNISDGNNKELTKQDKENKQTNAYDQSPDTETHSRNAVLNFLKKRMPIYTSSNQIESEMSYDGKTSSKDDDSGRQTSSSTSSSKAALLEELKMEIRDLVADYPEGVWCTDLISLYRQRYSRELNFTRFGYTSIISLVSVLEDAVRIARPVEAGDWLLTDARRATDVRPRRYLPASVARVAPAVEAKVDVDDALPGIDFDPDVFPVDCLHFMETIPPPTLVGLETGAMLEVMLGEVYSPSHFWLLRLGEEYNIAMEDIMDEMTKYYTYGEGKDRSLALGAVRVGHYCSSVYERDWHRSLIVRIVDSDTVKVRHVDYGTVESVRVRDLKPLRRVWAALPAQALRARLAAVRPPAAGRRWPHANSTHFLRLVRDKRLVANVVAVDRQEDILEVFLIDTTTDEDVCISTEMIRSGHADARGDSALRTVECYLFPRFDALEHGDTPNFGEIHAYLRDGIALDYVDEYRRHVPACLPPSSVPSDQHSSPPPGRPEDADDAASEAASDVACDANYEVPCDATYEVTCDATYEVPCDAAYEVPCDAASEASDEVAQDEDTGEDPQYDDVPATPPPRCRLTRAASSPGESSPPTSSAGPARATSAHPSITASNTGLELINRVPLLPLPPRFLPPARTPLPHAYSQVLPVPGFGFQPFPGAVPLYPPMYTPHPPMMMPPGPFPLSPYGPLMHHTFSPSPGSRPPAPHGSHTPAHHCPRTPAPQIPNPSAFHGPQFLASHGSQSRASLGPHPPVSRNPSAVRQPSPESHQTAPPTKPGPPRDASPPPPYNSGTGGADGAVTLSQSECEIFKLLSRVDAHAAHWYMMDAIARARGPHAADPTAPSAPLAPRVAAGTQTDVRLPPGMRPPPGFGD